MAKLSNFRTDSKAIHEGEWVKVGDEYDDLEIRTRGFTDVYNDAIAARQQRAARGMGGDVNKLPSALRRSINIECLIAHVVLDVRNLDDDDGKPVTKDAFHDLLRHEDYVELVVACYRAAGKVGQRKAAELEDAVGNSPTPSAGA